VGDSPWSKGSGAANPRRRDPTSACVGPRPQSLRGGEGFCASADGVYVVMDRLWPELMGVSVFLAMGC
jgi:hypothetical protein